MLKRAASMFFSLTFVLAAIVAGTAIWFSFYIDSQEFRDQFTKTLSAVAGAPVELEGELDISVWPALGIAAHGLQVSDGPEFGPEPMFSARTIIIRLQLMPLLKGNWELDRIYLEGAEVRLRRTKDGTANWQRFVDMASGQDQADQPSFATGEALVKGLEVADSRVVYEDRRAGQSLNFHGIGMTTGPIGPGEPVAVTLSAKFAERHGWVKGEVDIKGVLNLGDSKAVGGGAEVHAVFAGSLLPKGAEPGEGIGRLSYDPEENRLRLSDIQIGVLGVRAQGDLASEPLDGPLAMGGNIEIKPVILGDLAKALNQTMPWSGDLAASKISLRTRVAVDTARLTFKDLALHVGDRTVTGRVEYPFSQGRAVIRLNADELDVDRYLPPADANTAKGAGQRPDWAGLLRGLDLEAGFTCPKVTVRGESFVDASLDLTASGGELGLKARTVWQGAPSAAEALVTISGPADASVADMTVTASMKGIRADKLPLFDNIIIRVDGDADLKATVSWSGLAVATLPSLDTLFDAATVEAHVTLAPGRAMIDATEGGWNRWFPHTGATGLLRLKPAPSAKGWMTKTAHAELSTVLLDPKAKLTAVSDGPLSVADKFYDFTGTGLVSKAIMDGELVAGAKGRHVGTCLMGWGCRDEVFTLDDIKAEGLGGTATGTMHGSSLNGDDWRFIGQIGADHASFRKFMAQFGVDLPPTKDGTAFGRVRGSGTYLMNHDGISFPDAHVNFDGSSIQGTAKMVGYTHPYWELSLHADKFDLDRYLDEPREEGRPYVAPIKRKPDPLPLATLRGLRFLGPVVIDDFRYLKAKWTDVSAQVRAMDGDISVRQAKADFYGGSYTGEWLVVVSKDMLKSSLSAHAAKFRAGPFLTDVVGRDYFQGLSDLRLDFVSQGRTDIDMITSLQGRISAFVADGSYSFADPDKPRPKDKDGKPQPIRRTSFNSAQTVLDAKGGDFTVVSMGVDSLLLTSTGTGGFSIPRDTIDLRLKNDFVSLPSVAMRITGKLSDPTAEYSATGTVGDTVDNLLDLPQKPFRFLRDLFF